MRLRFQHHLDDQDGASHKADGGDEHREGAIAAEARDRGGIIERVGDVARDGEEEDERRAFGAAFHVAFGHDVLGLPQPDHDRDDGDDDQDDHDRGEDVLHPLAEASAKARGGDLYRLVRVGFRRVGEDEADQKRGARPVEPAHQDAEEADGEEGHQIHQVLARLEGGKRDDHEEEGR
ncbi:MAG: hypothetical protein AAFY59_14895, partial [Pseudomonadota bacterium]